MRLLLLTLTMLLAGAVCAQEVRIGYVDMKRLLDNAPQVLAGREALDLEFRPLNNQLMADEAVLLQMEQDLAAASGLSREQLAAREREIRNLQRSIERRREEIPLDGKILSFSAADPETLAEQVEAFTAPQAETPGETDGPWQSTIVARSRIIDYQFAHALKQSYKEPRWHALYFLTTHLSSFCSSNSTPIPGPSVGTCAYPSIT